MAWKNFLYQKAVAVHIGHALVHAQMCEASTSFFEKDVGLAEIWSCCTKNYLDFKRNLRWFDKFLPLYNGVSLYDHRPIDHTLELDACLTGLGGH